MITEEQMKQRCEDIFLSEVNNFVKISSIKGDYFYDSSTYNLFIFLVIPNVGWISFVHYRFNPDNIDYAERNFITAPSGSIDILKHLLCCAL